MPKCDQKKFFNRGQIMSSARPTSNDTNSDDPVIINERIQEKKFEKWRKRLMYFTGVGLTEQEKAEYHEEYQCKKCEKWRDKLMERSWFRFFFFLLFTFTFYFIFFFELKKTLLFSELFLYRSNCSIYVKIIRGRRM